MRYYKLLPYLLVLLVAAGCHDDKPDNTTPPDITETTEVKGYGLFNHLPGIWSGPIVSSTSVGNFPEYTADYRPISAAQISAKNRNWHGSCNCIGMTTNADSQDTRMQGDLK